ncbi:MAG: PD-(D/E)XK nuclease family transposase [Treponema sp.]|nr:PD-(D/E)XK nuclease family transposase [Treponema sp.]
MDAKQLAKRQKILAKIQEFTLMDDDFMTVFFDNDIPRTEYVLRIIMENDTLSVKSVKTQYGIKNLKGRSVRLDVRAEDAGGKVYDIEIQNADSGAGARRARYNSALMDADATVPKMDTEKLPETFVIFITANDVMKDGLPLYHINRKVEETNEPFNDGAHIIYVNGTYRGGKIGDLMHDFSCKKSADMKSAILAEKVRQLKEDDKGVTHMCKIMEDFAKEERDERDIETAAKLLEQKKMSEQEIADFFNFSDEQMKLVKKQVIVLA